MQPISYARHQFPPEIIRHAVWLYLRFALSYRDVEELLAERGLDISYETIQRWVLKFGPAFARNLRQLRPRPTGTWTRWWSPSRVSTCICGGLLIVRARSWMSLCNRGGTRLQP